MGKIFSLVTGCVLFLVGCGSGDAEPTKTGASVFRPDQTKQLNINILWDLSDRIDPSKNPASPEHFQRDLEIIKTFTELFKEDMDMKGAYRAGGKLKVFFTPPPADPQVNNFSKNMDVDLSVFKGDGSSKQKKAVYDSITQQFTSSAENIYQITLQNNQGQTDWDGSDIWRFFKNDVDQCIEADTSYRNILVIITDGYIYHKDSRLTEGNRTQFITAKTLAPFRNKSDWHSLFQTGDFGLIPAQKNLENIEILVLEISPSKGNRNDEDYIQAFLNKWFTEMGVKSGNVKVFPTDLPNNTKSRIKAFLNRK